MACDDPTEYTFAVAYLDGWEHWERLCKCSWFKPYISRWRHELQIRTRAAALAAIRAKAKSEDKDAFAANKFILSGGWQETTSRRGRPSKDEINQEAQRMAEEKSTLDEDFQRISLQ